MKHSELINKMTIEEKAAFLSGKTVWETRDFPRLNIPSIFCSDGPHGVRKQAGEGDHLGLNESLPATCFPTAATIANSWDEELGEEIGRALGEEAAAQEVNVLLGPGMNIKRNPLCGRNFEYFSEDPYLTGKMAAAYIRGIQSQGIYACPKHFAVNSQELRRMAMDCIIDERTLREIYLTGFEIAVKEGHAKSIMSAYNAVNGVYANENKHLLMDILRNEWGFDGIVITDWGGSNNHAKGVACRSNLEMPAPGLDSARAILEALNEGSLTKEELDVCVDDLLDAVLVLSEKAKNHSNRFDEERHHKIARKAAEESTVLLKNEENLLPLKQGTKVALIGDFAVEPRYQGAGSSMVNAIQLESMAEVIKEYDLEIVGVSRGYSRTGGANETLSSEAVAMAEKADVVIYCMGLDELSESEGLDRIHMEIPENQIKLLQKISDVNSRIVGVLSAGSAIVMPWERCCKAILHGYLGGQAGAGAMLDLLTGKANPSGHLNETLPFSYEDTPSYHYFPSKEKTSEYREGLYVGYRYYDTAKVPVRYSFGHGLSYTVFEYSNLKICKNGVEFELRNTGDRDGAEVAQMYVGFSGGKIFRPLKELKGFSRVFLKAGESRKIKIAFDDKTFRYWNIETQQWEIEEGLYRIYIGSSSSDIRLTGSMEVEGTTSRISKIYSKEIIPSYYSGRITEVDDREFEMVLGSPIPSGKWEGKLGENDAVCQMYYAKSRIARMIYRILTRKKVKSEAKGKPDLNILFIYNMPFRGIAKMTGGIVSREMVTGMVDAVNGHLWKGVKKIVSGYFRNVRENKEYEKRLSGGKDK